MIPFNIAFSMVSLIDLKVATVRKKKQPNYCTFLLVLEQRVVRGVLLCSGSLFEWCRNGTILLALQQVRLFEVKFYCTKLSSTGKFLSTTALALLLVLKTNDNNCFHRTSTASIFNFLQLRTKRR